MKEKLLPVIAVFLFLCNMAASQPTGEFKEWGQVTLAELNLTECSFEKNADALLLMDLGEIFYSNDGELYEGSRLRSTAAYYLRYKVLTDRGTEKASFKLRYRPDENESIRQVKATCYNLENGQIVKNEVAAVGIAFTKINQYETEMAFVVPGVKKGSVFEVSYQRNQYTHNALPSWYFNADVPCLQSTLRVGFLNAIEYYVKKQITHRQYEEKSEPFNSQIKILTSFGSEMLSGNTVTYTAQNLPSVPTELYMNSRVNYINHLSFQLKAFHSPFNPSSTIISSWGRYNRFMLDNPEFGQHLTGSGIPRKEIIDLLESRHIKNAPPVVKTKAIFEFVRDNMRWNGQLGPVAKEDNAQTWKQKSGNLAAINLLLLNTLTQEGIAAYPMLVGSRDDGYIFTEYPILRNLFTNVVVVVEMQDNKKLVLDASDKFLPFGLPRADILNNYGYVLRSAEDCYWYYVTEEASDDEIVFIKAALDTTGWVNGEIKTIYNNYTQAYKRNLKAMGKQDVITENLKKMISGVTIEQITDSVDAANNKYSQKVKFSVRPATDASGKIYISIPAIYGTTENPFVNEQRISDIDFGYKRKSSTILQLELPDNYELDSLFSAVRLRTSDTSINFLFDVEQVGQILSMRQKLEYSQSFYPVAAYRGFYDFHQKYFKLMQQPVVLRRRR